MSEYNNPIQDESFISQSEVESSPFEGNETIQRNKDTAAFSYTLIFAPLLLFTRRDNTFIVFHARQATLMLIFAILFWALGDIFRYFNIFILGGCAIGFMHAIEGEWFQIPFVYELSKNGFSSKKIIKALQSIFHYLHHVSHGALPQKVKKYIPPVIKPYSLSLEKRVEELEKLYFTEKYFHNGSLEEVSPILQEKFAQIRNQILDHQGEEKIKTPEFFKYTGEFDEIYIGGFNKKSFFIGFSKNIFPNKSCDFFLGNFGVIRIDERKTDISLF